MRCTYPKARDKKFKICKEVDKSAMITSKDNAKIKNVAALQKQSKARREQKLYVVEGVKMFTELPKKSIREIYATEAFADKNKELLKGLDVEVVDERIFAQMSDTKTPQGILCVVEQQQHSLDDLLALSKPLFLLLEDLQDPGNVGTIFRTAEGAGISGIIMSENCVDIYNPKTIRGAMGSVYRVPFLYVKDMAVTVSELKKRNVKTYAAHLKGAGNYDQKDYTKASAFLIGNEGNGLSEELAGLADELIKIPMEGNLESLNAAIAATILMYEGYRQRR